MTRDRISSGVRLFAMLLTAILLERECRAGDCQDIDDAGAVARHANVFFAVVANYEADASSGRIDLHLEHAFAAKGRVPSRVSVDPTAVRIKPLARHLFFTQDDGIVSRCSGSRPLKTSEVAPIWRRLQEWLRPEGPRVPPPALPIAAVASNFCSGGTSERFFVYRKVVTVFDDGTIVIENGPSIRKKRTKTVGRLRELRSSLTSAREGRGWLSFVPPGMQELSLYLDDGEHWSAGPTYVKCGRTSGRDDEYLTPRANALVAAILAAAGETGGFRGCACVERLR
jgi:hypothetical protein